MTIVEEDIQNGFVFSTLFEVKRHITENYRIFG